MSFIVEGNITIDSYEWLWLYKEKMKDIRCRFFSQRVFLSLFPVFGNKLEG